MIERTIEPADTRVELTEKQMRRECALMLKALFLGGGRLTVSDARDGSQRIRAVLPGGASPLEWYSNASFIEVARHSLGNSCSYAAEWHFPNRATQFTYMWQFRPVLNSLKVCRRDTTEDERNLPPEAFVEADAEHHAYFLAMVSELTNATELYDYEQSPDLANRYNFYWPGLKTP
ncbi:MAG: hypothetical protein EOT04_00745 [Candidatus Chaera renei]|uniref:Uncharacterized protein n=1 Tax=Candidatus Chaera renei TaxID=2506947 RepID=A0A4Q0AKX7_9BACT|nr:MAG: hypothetical protein EOT04_00745 [Candidatus Chaera renei]